MAAAAAMERGAENPENINLRLRRIVTAKEIRVCLEIDTEEEEEEREVVAGKEMPVVVTRRDCTATVAIW